jgi:hypothetical protein
MGDLIGLVLSPDSFPAKARRAIFIKGSMHGYPWLTAVKCSIINPKRFPPAFLTKMYRDRRLYK